MEINVSQVQRLLSAMGKSPGVIDGIWGRNSQAALDAACQQYGVAVAGNATTTSATDTVEPAGIYGSRYFSREEFRCQCDGKYCNGFPHEPTEVLVRGCDYLREKAGGPLYIRDKGGSGLRCPTWNSLKGGAARSNHLYGKAADLHPSNITPKQLYDLADAYLGNTGELGLYSWGIHFAPEGTYSRYKG